MTRRSRSPEFEYYEPPPKHLLGCMPEQALCYDFIDEAQLQGWRVIPEYPDSSLDLLLVAEEGCFTHGVTPGTQIGVQAKMSANLDLLRQMMNSSEPRKRGPDYLVALVPGRSCTETEVVVEKAIKRLGLGFFRVYDWFEGHHANRNQRHENLHDTRNLGRHLKFQERIPMPEVESWTEPGVASPTPVTQWQMRALKFIIELEKVEKFDYNIFAAHKMHVQTWLAQNWIIQDGKEGRRFLYRLNPNSPADRPDLKHREVKLKLEKKNAQRAEAPHQEERDSAARAA